MKIFSVSQVNRLIKDLVDNEVTLEDIIVTGELSSFSITRNIAYFTLKDNDNLLNCIKFSARESFQVGDMVQCRGNVKYYPKGGKISFNALSIEHCGQGELYQKFLLLKAKLEEEGLFDQSKKIPIPKYPRSIGVVTSATGAVLQDIRNVTSRRNPSLDIYVYDAQVQGKYAVKQVIDGITYFDNFSDVDVIIVARGGGSLEDLMPFNDEEMARVTAMCNKPLISAVGHETDFSILDFVADLRAPTPSAAAELVSFDLVDLKQYICDLDYTINLNLQNKIFDLDSRLKLTTINIEKSINSITNENILYVNDLLNGLDRCIEQILDDTKYRVDIALNTLDKLNPLKLLRAGYSVVTTSDRLISATNISVGDEVKIEASDIILNAKIINKEIKNDRK